MKKFFKIFLVTFLISGTAIFTNSFAANAAQNNPESIGTHSNGCFAGGEELPFSGTGYEVVKTERKRYYGNPVMIKFIEDLATKFHKKYKQKLLISDLAQKNGGPMPGDHASHQIGLDVDIWNSFYTVPEASINKTLSDHQRNNLKPSDIVNGKSKTLTKNWTEANEIAIINAASDERVDRIFVNPVIKNRFCRMYPRNANQYKIRSWYGHDKHFHVRLKCPENSPECKIEKPLDITDNGCKPEQLDWWLSGQAYTEIKKDKAKQPKKFEKKLPERCGDIVGK